MGESNIQPAHGFARYRLRVFAAVGLLLAAAAAFLYASPAPHLYEAGTVSVPCIYIPPEREHWAQANCHGVSRIGGQEAEMRFNSEGIRDKEYAPRAPKGTYRILVLGSSNTFGPGIKEEDTFPRRLEVALRSRGRQAEVINAAMLGYCSIQTTFRLKHLLERYSPDLVLFQFVQGSCPLFDGAWRERLVFSGGDPLRIDRTPFRPAERFAALNAYLFSHGSLFFLWLTAADQLLKARFSREYTASASLPDRVAAYLAPTLEMLRYMDRVSKEKGARFEAVSYRMRVFTQSVPVQMYAPVARVLSRLIHPVDFGQDKILDYLRENGISVFRSAFTTSDQLLPGDVHLSPEGLRLFAESVADELAPRIPAAKKAR